ncbi:helix-turn-helix transcriptional regulator [Actinocrispum wychmicini]|nr:helix-turn-helix transcriptional regulator [Actinocrispum wychmicini]
MSRRILLIIVGAAAVCLVPWTIYLADSLPDRYRASEWRLAWVGFDVALVCCFATAAWLGLRRRRAAVPVLAATAALLCADAWFDVVFDWNSKKNGLTSLLMAVFLEVPLAMILLWHARKLLVGGMPRRKLTVRDVEINRDESYLALSRALKGLAPATADTLATDLGVPVAEVTARLTTLAEAGHVRQGRDGRWRTASLSIEQPDPAGMDHRLKAYLDEKYDNELRLLTWAARNRDEFGGWAKGHRSVLHLSEADLARFDAEYDDLLTRYCLTHDKAGPGTREIALRFYAFPYPEEATR